MSTPKRRFNLLSLTFIVLIIIIIIIITVMMMTIITYPLIYRSQIIKRGVLHANKEYSSDHSVDVDNSAIIYGKRQT